LATFVNHNSSVADDVRGAAARPRRETIVIRPQFVAEREVQRVWRSEIVARAKVRGAEKNLDILLKDWGLFECSRVVVT
jgi:hypothetical protein